MASKLIELNEAARLIGVTPEKLLEMRQKGDVFGYRDGTSWKFKQEEIDRVLAEKAGGGTAYDQDFDHLMPDPMSEEESSGDMDSVSILVTDDKFGKSPPTASSTIIGKNRDASPADSDIQLIPEGSDIELVSDAGASDLKLVGNDGSDIFSAKEAKLKDTGSATGDLPKPKGPSKPAAKGAAGSDVFAGDELKLKKSGSGTGDLPVAAGGSDALSLDDDAMTLDDGSALSLDEDDDLVLGGSGKGSGILDAAGSGINLKKPSDSGLSLDQEPLELSGSQVESLELPEDEDVLALDDVADSDDATQLKADEEFLLSPTEDSMADESSDSGSQVIALEESDSFDENAVTMLKPTGGDGALLATEGSDMLGAAMGGMGTGGMTASMAGPTQYIPVPMPDVPYSLWNVLSLVSILFIMTFSGMLMGDLLRNMWNWDGAGSINISLTDALLKALNM